MRRASMGVLLATLVFATGTEAQTAQKFSVQASFLGARLTGISNEQLRFGGGGEFQIRYNPNRFSIGIGFQSTRHTVDRNTVTFNGGFLEPRFVVLTAGDIVALYAAARFMTLSATFEIAGEPFIVDGAGFSGGGGLLIAMGSRVNGDIGLTVGKEYYEGEAADGVTVVTRLGLAIGLF
jgi:hypothetical protein